MWKFPVSREANARDLMKKLFLFPSWVAPLSEHVACGSLHVPREGIISYDRYWEQKDNAWHNQKEQEKRLNEKPWAGMCDFPVNVRSIGVWTCEEGERWKVISLLWSVSNGSTWRPWEKAQLKQNKSIHVAYFWMHSNIGYFPLCIIRLASAFFVLLKWLLLYPN